MNKANFTHLFIISAILLSLSSCTKNKWEFKSPNQEIRLILQNTEGDEGSLLYYSISKNNDESSSIELIAPSKLGLKTDYGDLYYNLKVKSINTFPVINEEYKMSSGGAIEYKSKFLPLEVSFINSPLKVKFRLYDNGVAFQYQIDDLRSKTIEIFNEYTTFNTKEGKFWAHPYDTITKWTPGYETYYEGPLNIGTPAPEDKNGWAFPILVNTKGHWLFLSESGFDGSYGASHLEMAQADSSFKVKFPEKDEANNIYPSSSTSELPWISPWRFVTIGNDLADIVESHMTTDLAPPLKHKDTEWIIPGHSSWSWWSDNDSPQDFNRLVPFIDLSAKMGWKYSLIDANWNQMRNGSLKKLVKYANSKNVDLLIWYNSGGKHNSIPEEPRDIMDSRGARRTEFERISKMGIKGIKVDFFQSDKQAIIKQYIEILEDAAEFKLLVNFHGCTLPKGWRRTYPHLLTMEAIRGAETYIFDNKYPQRAPSHIATIPFLRGVCGPTDYTPVGLSNNKYPRLTSDAFELALPIIIESGLTHFTEKPEVIYNLPVFAINYLKTCPVSWDDTKYLAGFPGKEAIIARKKGKKWYVAAINGEKAAKTIQLNLTKLKVKGANAIEIIDAPLGNGIQSESFLLNNQTKTINLKPFGGYILIIDSN